MLRPRKPRNAVVQVLLPFSTPRHAVPSPARRKEEGPARFDATCLAAAVARLSAGEATNVTRGIREAASSLARAAALNLDRFWNAAKSAPSGPVDVIDMFCGCGGMSAGFRAVNGAVPAYRLAAAVDVEPVANRTYEANLGLAPAQVDVAALARRPKMLEAVLASRRPGAPLVLIGCAPCQGFSSHRNKAGDKDPRNSLFVDFARIASSLRPDAVVMENVPELLTEQYWPLVAAAREVLESSGYYVHLMVHNVAEFGVPQERFRALMLAMRKPFAVPRGFLERGNFRTVREAIRALPPVSAGERDPSDEQHFSAGHKASTLATIRAVPKDGGSRPENVGPECLRRAAEKTGRAAYEDVYGRLFWDRPAITITAYARNPASGRFVHPAQDRGLTIREAALLQAFPSTYSFEGSLDDRFRQIGNAVPAGFASYLAAHVLGELLAPSVAEADFDRGITQAVGPSFSRLIPALKAGHRQQGLAPVAASR